MSARVGIRIIETFPKPQLIGIEPGYQQTTVYLPHTVLPLGGMFNRIKINTNVWFI